MHKSIKNTCITAKPQALQLFFSLQRTANDCDWLCPYFNFHLVSYTSKIYFFKIYNKSIATLSKEDLSFSAYLAEDAAISLHPLCSLNLHTRYAVATKFLDSRYCHHLGHD